MPVHYSMHGMLGWQNFDKVSHHEGLKLVLGSNTMTRWNRTGWDEKWGGTLGKEKLWLALGREEKAGLGKTWQTVGMWP